MGVWQEILNTVRSEFAESVADVLMRRTLLAFETRDHGMAVAPRVASIMGAILGWTAEGIGTAVADYGQEVTRVFGINP